MPELKKGLQYNYGGKIPWSHEQFPGETKSTDSFMAASVHTVFTVILALIRHKDL